VAEPLAIKDCVLAAISTGRRAYTVRELAVHAAEVEESSLHYHFWGGRLLPRFDDPEFQNDFASWARHAAHDYVLAERLGIIDPTQFADMDELRRELVDVIEGRAAETDWPIQVPLGLHFTFIRAQIVVFDTQLRIADPRALRARIRSLSLGSVFYHFIEARRRAPAGMDDFRAWLEQFGAATEGLRGAIGGIDPYFCTLTQLRERLAAAVEREVAA
jgi:hypothetical protein